MSIIPSTEVLCTGQFFAYVEKTLSFWGAGLPCILTRVSRDPAARFGRSCFYPFSISSVANELMENVKEQDPCEAHGQDRPKRAAGRKAKIVRYRD